MCYKWRFYSIKSWISLFLGYLYVKFKLLRLYWFFFLLLGFRDFEVENEVKFIGCGCGNY